jgi:caffeoyl-CoA O-methyltransferase
MLKSTEIVQPDIERYITGLTTKGPSFFQAIEAQARVHGVPIIGPAEGLFLYLLARSSGARRVLELGTATGYSALWLAHAVAPIGGRVITIEANPDRARLARDHIARAGFQQVIEVIEGDALQYLASSPGPYDFIFVDVLLSARDADFAPRLLEMCVARLSSGGFLVADNALAAGRVLDANTTPEIVGLKRYNEAAAHHPDLETVIIPLRDGVSLSRKK